MRHVLLLPALALTLAACGGDAETADAETPRDTAVPVEVLVADPGFFEDTIELTGTVDANNDATLSPDVPGMLTYVAPVGAFVRAGQTVAQVRASTQQAGVSNARAGVSQSRAGVAQAEAGIAQARATVSGAEAGVRAARAQREAAQAGLDLALDQYRRQLPLYRDSILSALEFRQVETQVAQARAQVAQADAGIAQAQGQLRASREGIQAAQAQRSAAVAATDAAQAGVSSAQSQLASTRIVAPFAGVVEARLQETGELATPGQPVVRLVGSGSVKVTAGVPERYAGEIEQGTQVEVSPNAYAVEPRGGRVSFVGAAIEEASRTFPIEVAVENADRSLKPSMVVRLNVTRDVLQNVIVVPTEAVVRDERGTSVFVVATDTAGTVASRREVELGPDAGDTVVLRSGVQPGDRIIVSGAVDLSEGERVRVTETRPALAVAGRSAPTTPGTPTETASRTSAAIVPDN